MIGQDRTGQIVVYDLNINISADNHLDLFPSTWLDYDNEGD
jgi:hypothetical protein